MEKSLPSDFFTSGRNVQTQHKSSIVRGYLRLALCLAFLLFMAPAAKATHYHGGILYYNYLGDGRYEIFSKTYWSKDEVTGIIYRYQGMPKLESAVKTVSKTLMPDGLTVEHLQKQTIRWTQPGTYEVYWKNCCRSVGTNFDNEEIGLFMVINYNTNTPSSSPVFNGFPELNHQPGHRLSFNLNLTDPDGHEQVYTLVKPHSSPDTVYDSMFASGFKVSEQGLVTWQNPLPGKWVVNVRVQEKVNGVLTGAYIQQDFVINIATCVLPAPTYTITAKPCAGTANGQIVFDVPEGAAPFKFSIDDGKTYQDSPEFNNLPWGYYTGIVKDASGCASHHTHIKLENAVQPQLTFNLPKAVCANAGKISLAGSPAGGVYQGAGVQSGYFYPEAAGIGTHTLTYTYTYNNTCTASATTTITVTEPLLATAGPGATVYYGYEPQSCTTLTATVTGGTAPYTYSWSTGETTQSIQVCPSATTVYQVLVTDALGCTTTSATTVTVQDVRPPAATGSNPNKPDFVIVCKDGNTQEIQAKNVEKALEKGATLGACLISTTATINTSSAMFAKDKASTKLQLLAYPNPVPYNGILKLRANKSETLKIELVDMAGKKVKVLFEGAAALNQEITVELEKIVKGNSVYILKVTSPTEQLNYKLMVL